MQLKQSLHHCFYLLNVQVFEGYLDVDDVGLSDYTLAWSALYYKSNPLCCIVNLLFFFQICHSKSGDINPMKIKSLVEAYVSRFIKHKGSKDSVKLDDIEISPSVKANGVKLKTNR